MKASTLKKPILGPLVMLFIIPFVCLSVLPNSFFHRNLYSSTIFCISMEKITFPLIFMTL
ncbi:hypothetical protein NEOC65_001676 [Neochlamydia sp. AcF65]|nr:hypothetical protein [Neochlamydia sp. AcF65]NGY95414.1 hypothetical protein [Neochlamydia sp. AcF84]